MSQHARQRINDILDDRPANAPVAAPPEGPDYEGASCAPAGSAAPEVSGPAVVPPSAQSSSCSPPPERSKGEGPGARQPSAFQSALAYRRAVNILFDTVIELDLGLSLPELINALDRVLDILNDARNNHEAHADPTCSPLILETAQRSQQERAPEALRSRSAGVRPPSTDTDLWAEHATSASEQLVMHMQAAHGWNPARIAQACQAMVDDTGCLDPEYSSRIADALASVASRTS